ncbi:MAG: magnesium and cobalt transport protein CorA [Anaerolinea sp.]|nr:magnesium and cobalt transport protein CorA [Anaerolinea sp.]
MINSFYFENNQIHYSLPPEEIVEVINSGDGLLWVNLDNPSENELVDTLHGLFKFHPLTIEDCQSQGFQTAKVDDFRDYLFIIAHVLHVNDGSELLETDELNVFLGKNYVVTTHHSPSMNPVNLIWQRLEKDERLMLHGADFLCHAILDALVDDYMPLIDKLDEDIEFLEDRVLQKPDLSTLERILNLKHSTLTLRRLLSPQREVMNILSRDEFPQIKVKHRIYFRDIYDHLVRVQDLSESVRDIVSGTLDIYLTATSNRLNEVMKALTIVSTLFLPLTFIAGIYGMNFVFFPEIHWQYGYAFVWGLFLIISGGMIWYFKKRQWI